MQASTTETWKARMRTGIAALCACFGMLATPAPVPAQNVPVEDLELRLKEIRNKALIDARNQLRRGNALQLGGVELNGRVIVQGNVFDQQGNGIFGEGSTAAAMLPAAAVKTDSEMESLLERAETFAERERFDLSAILWQQVVDRSADVVFTKDEWLHRSLRHTFRKYRGITTDIESTLAALPVKGLEAYRLKWDGEARSILRVAGRNQRESALAEVVQRYFLSSVGDDAAFELACLKLDRFEFLPAARLLAKILKEYPDPSVPRGELMTRLAAANARVGDIAGARELIAQLREGGDGIDVATEVIDLVAEDVEQTAAQQQSVVGASSAADGWFMAMGNARRTGAMPSPKDWLGAARGLVPVWEQDFRLGIPKDWEMPPFTDYDPYAMPRLMPQLNRIIPNANDPFAPLPEEPEIAEGKEEAEDPLLARWRDDGWLPAGQLALVGDRVLFKNNFRVVCCDAATGELTWLGHRNKFPIDEHSRVHALYSVYSTRSSVGQSERMGTEEVELFEDRVHQTLCVAGNLVITFQGPPQDGDDESREVPEDAMNNFRRARNRGWAGAMSSRSRGNQVAAYDVATGKLRWRRYANDGEFETGVSFGGSPAPYGSLLLTPVHLGNALWIYAFSLDDGKTLWKSYLANEPGGTVSPSSPVAVAVDGGDAYVASGAGIVFSIDAISGVLNWAIQYPRSRKGTSQVSNRGWGGTMTHANDLLDGWREDTIIPAGRNVIVAPSDANYLFAFDRRTGELAWETGKIPFTGYRECDQVLGVVDGKLLVAGSNVVRCYRAAGGLMLWEREIGTAYGRGMVASDAVYMPQMDSILRLDLATGAMLSKVPVKTEPGEPVGNLYSDGKRVFIFGLRRVAAFHAGEVEVAAGKPPAPPEVPDAPKPDPAPPAPTEGTN